MDMSDSQINRVVIVGGGTAGWMAAAVIAQGFKGRLSVELIESEEIGTVGVGEATIPQIALLNRYLKIDETDFITKTNGSMKLGIEFVNWGRQGDRYIHTFGGIGRDHDIVGFHNFWLRARAMGMDVGLWDYSLHALSCHGNKFERLRGRAGSEFMAYAYHFDAALYAAYLRAYSEERGVRRTEGKIVDVTLHGETGHVASVTLESGREVLGDLFIDCSGFRGLLIEGALKTGYDDWSDFLPCDRAWAVPCESVAPLTPYTRSTARKAGWQWRIPLQTRTGNGHVYCSRYISDDEAASILMANLDGKALAEPRLIKFITGKRKKAWNKNVVTLGLASGFMEPLESTSIHLVQTGIARLMDMFPTSGFSQADIDQYNLEAMDEFVLIRDFLVLHYHLNQRTDSQFWIDCREMAVPDSLTHKMKLFEETALIRHDKRDLFSEPSWLQVMVGQGLIPKNYHPMAETMEAAELRKFLAGIKSDLHAATASMSTHSAWLAKNAPAIQAEPMLAPA
jgi:tryptophan 7-halogenase